MFETITNTTNNKVELEAVEISKEIQVAFSECNNNAPVEIPASAITEDEAIQMRINSLLSSSRE